MEIKVKCERPKYASGEYKFSSFEELFHWLIRIKGLSKGAIGGILCGLAENGIFRIGNARCSISINGNFKMDYILISELGYKIGFFKTRRFSKYPSRDREVALQFAKELDGLSSHKKEG